MNSQPPVAAAAAAAAAAVAAAVTAVVASAAVALAAAVASSFQILPFISPPSLYFFNDILHSPTEKIIFHFFSDAFHKLHLFLIIILLFFVSFFYFSNFPFDDFVSFPPEPVYFILL